MTLTSGTDCGGKTPDSLQLPLGVLARVLLVKLVRTGTCPVTGCCLSGLLLGETRLFELERGVHL